MSYFHRPDNPIELETLTIQRVNNVLVYNPERRGYEVEVIPIEDYE